MSQEILTVVITSPIDEPLAEKIKAVSDRIRVDPVAHWVVAEKKGDFANEGHLNRLLQRAEVIFGWIHQFPKNLPARTDRLKWIQVMTAGIDRLPEEILKSGIRVANASGLHGAAMGEVVLEMMLMFVKDAPACMRMKQGREWRRYRPGLLRDRTVGVLGLGAVGKEIARLCKAFGMKVIGIRRSGGAASPIPDVDRVYPRERLPELLAESDFLVLALPLTKETEGMIGEKELRGMKPTAFLINVARGAIVDEGALIRALEEKWIAGAGLDVFTREPLPPESPFYTMPNVLFSPHISGDIPDYELRAVDVFCENLRRYLAGDPFLHEVDREKGY
ncbi:MAG: D-2-hydroxyacid dehydrogenase [Proteobacteria bacterium]|nr:D-2-hydroxyacid dehydrogenase [Pseudomonadota bacterium]MBU4581968.1 D-2-hydroxyacid dehydrogenase [Pseudomonadota bacterium]